jgi:hypothetical protein
MLAFFVGLTTSCAKEGCAVDRLPVLSLLLLVGKYLRQLLPLPTWEDSASVREWARKLVGVLTTITAQTATALDDAAVRAFSKIVESDEAWAAFYALVVGMFKHENDILSIVGGDPLQVEDVAAKAGVDPATIALILQLIQQFGPVLVELIQKWRNRRNPSPEPTPGPAI